MDDPQFSEEQNKNTKAYSDKLSNKELEWALDFQKSAGKEKLGELSAAIAQFNKNPENLNDMADALYVALRIAFKIYRELPAGATNHPKPERAQEAALGGAQAFALYYRFAFALVPAGDIWTNKVPISTLRFLIPMLLVISNRESNEPALILQPSELDALEHHPELLAWKKAVEELLGDRIKEHWAIG